MRWPGWLVGLLALVLVTVAAVNLLDLSADALDPLLENVDGIFHLAEFAVLTHVPIRRLPSSLGSPQAVLQRFGISP